MGYNLELTQAAKDNNCDNGYDVQIGTCRLKSAMQKYLEDNLANVVLGGVVAIGNTILRCLDHVKPTIVWKNSL